MTELFVAKVSQFPDGERRIVAHQGREIGVFHWQGKFYAYENLCVHQGGPACEGIIMGYRTCYYRTFNVVRATPAQHDAYKKAREWLDNAIARIKPGASTAHICEVFPKANEFGFPDEMAAFGLQFAHGLGLNLHERPIISRVVSMDHPTEIKEGMVFAIETYCPATDGFSAARIEEEVVVTDKGCRLISLFPAEELPISAKY